MTPIRTTISKIEQSPRKWSGPNGDMFFIQGSFQDDSEWSVGFKAEDRARACLAELNTLTGKEGSFDVDYKPERNGRKQYKLLSWPGKPPAQGFGGKGGGGFQVRYRDTEEGQRREQDSIHRSVALQHAVGYAASAVLDTDRLLAVADRFYDWLSKGQPPIAQQQEQPAQPAQETPKAPERPPVAQPANKTMPPCPKCDQGNKYVLEDREKKGNYFCWKNPSRDKHGCGHKWTDVGAMAEALGVSKPDAIKTAFELAKEEIVKATKDRNADRLKLIYERICQRVDDNSISLEQAEDLNKDIADAKKALLSDASHAAWMDARIKEAQRKLQEQQEREMSGGLTQKDIPF